MARGEVEITLELRDLVIGFPRPLVLDRLSLRVHPGEILAVAGLSPFGGTTLARLIAGTLRPDAGAILIDGDDVTYTPPGRRPVGFVPAGGGLLPHLTVSENITFGLRLRGEHYAVEWRLADHADRLELRPLLALRPYELSPGQRLRVALARAAARLPKVLVVDATAGATGLAGLRQLIHRACASAETPAVVCTDRPAVVAEADRVAVLRAGRAALPKSPHELKAAPPDLTTARLVWPTPLVVLAGTVRQDGIDCAPVTAPHATGRITLPRTSELRGRQQVQVAVPSEALSLAPAEGNLPGRVVDLQPHGSGFLAMVELHGLPGIRWPVAATAAARPHLDEPVGLWINADWVFLFDVGQTESWLGTPSHGI
jgi:ABC-type sugar transport system ATPase subunit